MQTRRLIGDTLAIGRETFGVGVGVVNEIVVIGDCESAELFMYDATGVKKIVYESVASGVASGVASERKMMMTLDPFGPTGIPIASLRKQLYLRVRGKNGPIDVRVETSDLCVDSGKMSTTMTRKKDGKMFSSNGDFIFECPS